MPRVASSSIYERPSNDSFRSGRYSNLQRLACRPDMDRKALRKLSRLISIGLIVTLPAKVPTNLYQSLMSCCDQCPTDIMLSNDAPACLIFNRLVFFVPSRRRQRSQASGVGHAMYAGIQRIGRRLRLFERCKYPSAWCRLTSYWQHFNVVGMTEDNTLVGRTALRELLPLGVGLEARFVAQVCTKTSTFSLRCMKQASDARLR